MFNQKKQMDFKSVITYFDLASQNKSKVYCNRHTSTTALFTVS